MSAADARYAITFPVAIGSDDDRRDTLLLGGPLIVQPNSWLAQALPVTLLRNRFDGSFNVDQHTIEELILPLLTWDAAILFRDFAWILLPTRASRLLWRADESGEVVW